MSSKCAVLGFFFENDELTSAWRIRSTLSSWYAVACTSSCNCSMIVSSAIFSAFECVHRSINVEFAETSAQERKGTPTIARDKKGGSLVGFSRGEASRQCSVKRLHACISTYFHGLRLDLLLCFRHFLLKQRYTRSLVLHLL